MSANEINLTEFQSDFSEKADLPSAYVDFFSRLSDRMGSSNVMTALADWIVRNTFIADVPWSFRDHEFQIDIANDVSPDGAIMKCTQVGLSELSIRIALGLLAVTNGRSLIYVLPSKNFASEFTKSRIDPVIETSPKLSQMVIAAANSSLMKRIGNSILYIGGAATKKQAISRPAQALVVDEFDFCNMEVMTSYNSRLSHAGDRYYRRMFSSPTIADFGIAAEYERSTKKRYFVKCGHCSTEQAVDFNTQVRIPGWRAKEFKLFDKDDLNNESYRIDEAYLACRKCSKELDRSLASAGLRRWVPEYPNRKMQGWAVKPFDLIKYNSTPVVIRRLGDYFVDQDYWNFVQGETFASDSNQINLTIVRRNTCLREEMSGHGYFMGIDVGKTCHVLIGKPEDGQIKIVRALRIKATETESLFDQICTLFDAYSCYRAVIDAGPDFSLGDELHKRYGEFFHQCVYVKGAVKEMSYFVVDEDTNVASCARTKGFDALVQDINKGKWQWPDCPEMKADVTTHLKGMKRAETINEEGERIPRWVKIPGPDHYMHAAFYLKCAIDIDENPERQGVEVVGSTGIVTGVTIAKSGVPTPGGGYDIRALVGMFGVR